jgi:carbamoyltransferase
MNAPHILGLSGLAHDSAAAIIGEDGIVAAIEESKLLRARTQGGIPREAIRFCLERAGTGWPGLECVAVAGRPVSTWVRHAWLRTRRTPFAPVPSGYYQTKALGELGRELNNHRILDELAGRRAEHFDHHLCHAASAFYASPADRALVLTLDEQGDGIAGMAALGEGSRLRKLRRLAFPHSPGGIFTQVTDLLGFTPRKDEHKTQWLGVEGEPAFENVFLEMLRRRPGDAPHLDFRFFNRGLAGKIAFSKKFYRAVGLEPGAPPGDPLRRQLAASVQQACSRVAAEWAEALRKQWGVNALCLAGGVFLNPVIVSYVERHTGFDRVYVQPAAGNEGTALGAAWLAWHQLRKRARIEPPGHLYWGPGYSNQEIKGVLENCKARFRWHDSEEQRIEETLRLFEAGKIVGWYQGEAEFGPRALGNRSLLASPWAPYVKENLNEYVKHREAYRPFAIAVPAEDAARYFEASANARFMATLADVRPEARGLLAGFLLPGHRVRLHTVEREANPLFWRLLRRFGERSQAPMLVNTSFNLFGEPLALTPRDAVRSYFCSGMDALVIGSFSLSKS